MKYLEINSNFIKNEFENRLYNALETIKSNSRRGNNQGAVDCAMSTFGQEFDNLIENYFMDHLKICRKFNHKDDITLTIVRHLNNYRKLGVHAMFKKMYPDHFKKLPMPANARRRVGGSVFNRVMGSEEMFYDIDNVIRGYVYGDYSVNGAAERLMKLLESSEYAIDRSPDDNGIQHIRKMLNGCGYINNRLAAPHGIDLLLKASSKGSTMRDMLRNLGTFQSEPEPKIEEGTVLQSFKVSWGSFNTDRINISTTTLGSNDAVIEYGEPELPSQPTPISEEDKAKVMEKLKEKKSLNIPKPNPGLYQKLKVKVW